MDRTAIAAIIIGFGGTVAAMVMPQKYPQAPKWAVELSWWGGLFLIAAGGVVLLTEFTFGDLSGAVLASFRWLFEHLVAFLWLPELWVVIAFFSGIAVNRSYNSFQTRVSSDLQAGPQVTEWLTPLQAVERFVSPELLSKDRAAQEKANQLREKVRSLEVQLAGEPESDRATGLREQLESQIKNREDADYIAKGRGADVLESLRLSLISGQLVGKGCKIIKKSGTRTKDKETHISKFFWNYTIGKNNILDLDLQTAMGYLGQYDDVLIGKNESFKPSS